MARLARVVIPFIPHHIIQRGNRRQNVFFCDEDKDIYIELLSEFTGKNGVSVWGYSLMDNHVHMVAVPNNSEGLTKGIGETHRRYSRMVNFREGWRGHLWQGRYISYPMDERHLYAAIRYIERNPVRAGMVEKAEDYKWSSARAHVFGLKDKILSGDKFMIEQIGDWRAFLRSGDDQKDTKLLKMHARTGRPLGDETFIKKLEIMTGRIFERRKSGPKPRN